LDLDCVRIRSSGYSSISAFQVSSSTKRCRSSTYFEKWYTSSSTPFSSKSDLFCNAEQRKALEKIYQDIYEVLDQAFKIKEDSSSAVIFYSTLFQNCKDKGIFDKLVERTYYITNSNSNIISATDLMRRSVYHAWPNLLLQLASSLYNMITKFCLYWILC
jgi:hypothetical protein